ncbi:MAG: hypothetical protein A3F84_13190 [Candidatus Handelsmanbacteria bacterium RIFCSPLOWO2_12_FULL_64_10]|uniref:Response regulatory domain-containing protein n=1 Tax=Handelsmanbacteria sp. (strain RIFCSPLOWO2_12_FULL_64_10) TaxID=1817868 RepID=A0A1F6D0G4_HANXR|nr:MAG: hypothetical protein A3F84_13190 [Candidatus Handelsmanbacteria bacterium RIFCSPLOWO2_12_FULL_64_10]
MNSDSNGANRPRVLLVDDMPANLGLLRDALEEKGYRIAVATSGQGALRIASNSAPNLILLDVVMPEMDGYETCRRLKADGATPGHPRHLHHRPGREGEPAEGVSGRRRGLHHQAV